MKKWWVILAGGLLASSLAVSSVFASVPAHRHYILTDETDPTSKVYVGPNFCDNENTGIGFEQFHLNVHKSNPTLKAFEMPNNPVKLLSESCDP